MDELKLNLTTKFMKGIVTKIIQKALQKQFGCNICVDLNKIEITHVDGKVHLHVDVDAETSDEDFMKLIKTVGLN